MHSMCFVPLYLGFACFFFFPFFFLFFFIVFGGGLTTYNRDGHNLVLLKFIVKQLESKLILSGI